MPGPAYVAGQNASPLTSNPLSQTQPPKKKSKGWKIYFALLAIVNLVTVILPLIVLVWAIRQAEAGVSGTEYVGFVLLPLLYASVVVAIVNIVSIIFCIYRYRPRRLLMWFGIVVCLLSLGYLAKFGPPIYRAYFELKSHQEIGSQEATISKRGAISAINSCMLIELKQMRGTSPRLVIQADGVQPPLGTVKYAENDDWDDLKAAVENAPALCGYDEATVLEEGTVRPLLPITIDRARELILGCANDFKGIDLYYDYIYVSGTTLGNKISKDIVESSSTGILLAFSTTSGTPESIHIAARNVDHLLPFARGVQKNCNYNFDIRYGDALHGNDKIEGRPS